MTEKLHQVTSKPTGFRSRVGFSVTWCNFAIITYIIQFTSLPIGAFQWPITSADHYTPTLCHYLFLQVTTIVLLS